MVGERDVYLGRGKLEIRSQKLLQKSGHKVAMAAQTIAKAAGAKREWKQGTDFME